MIGTPRAIVITGPLAIALAVATALHAQGQRDGRGGPPPGGFGVQPPLGTTRTALLGGGWQSARNLNSSASRPGRGITRSRPCASIHWSPGTKAPETGTTQPILCVARD